MLIDRPTFIETWRLQYGGLVCWRVVVAGSKSEPGCLRLGPPQQQRSQRKGQQQRPPHALSPHLPKARFHRCVFFSPDQGEQRMSEPGGKPE